MLEARGLAKWYSGIPAVKDVSFTIRPGEVLGYLGPNGSGKTTTVNMLVGMLEPSQGVVLFEGSDIRGNLVEYRRRVGYVPEEPHLYPFLSGREYLQLVGRLRGIPSKLLERKIEQLLEHMALGWSIDQSIGSYSKGMKQKVLIVAALLHDPDVLIFDEPLSGLDVTTAMVFRELAHGLARAGRIILYSSHVLEVVEKLATRVIILYQGRVVADDSVQRLREIMARESLEDVFTELVEQRDPATVAADIIQAMAMGSRGPAVR
jgi:ABC-2 type transport system ATP-binding protein